MFLYGVIFFFFLLMIVFDVFGIFLVSWLCVFLWPFSFCFVLFVVREPRGGPSVSQNGYSCVTRGGCSADDRGTTLCALFFLLFFSYEVN